MRLVGGRKGMCPVKASYLHKCSVGTGEGNQRDDQLIQTYLVVVCVSTYGTEI